MKKIILSLSAALLALMAISSCGSLIQTSGNSGQGSSARSLLGGNGINPDRWNANDKASVTITHFPTTIEEFADMVDQIGTTPQGAVAMELVAMEVYRRNQSVGLECLKLVNTESNMNSLRRHLPDKLRGTDSYARPYLVAAFFQGANPENGYNPSYPYVVKVKTNPNRPYEESNMLKGTVIHLMVYSDGYDTPWRPISVVKQWGENFYRVSENSSTYVQCKEISYKATWNGLNEE
jgi:hypothetical protein